MRVAVEIELDLPEGLREFPEAELLQVFFDAYVNYVVCKHAEDALTWCARAKVGSDDEDLVGKRIYENHAMWIEGSKPVSWNLKRLD